MPLFAPFMYANIRAEFKPSDFSIINTDGHSDFDIEKRLTVQDAKGRKLDLALNYVCVHHTFACYLANSAAGGIQIPGAHSKCRSTVPIWSSTRRVCPSEFAQCARTAPAALKTLPAITDPKFCPAIRLSVRAYSRYFIKRAD